MPIPKRYKGRYFYHFTHIENLASILKNGLLSINMKNIKAIPHIDISSETIQHRRSGMNVSCPPMGNVHDYVPFYFCTVNPMLLGILNRKNIDQPWVIYFAVSIDRVEEYNVVFTDASANTIEPPNFYYNPDDLRVLDWNAIDNKKWGCSNDAERHRRMSEVLIYEAMPLDWIEAIIVYNKYALKRVNSIFKKSKMASPKILYQPFNGKYFYFTKFYFPKRKNETLVTGPGSLKNNFEAVVEAVIEERSDSENENYLFANIGDAVTKLNNDFCLIKEMADIYELETENEMHSDTVSDHTKNVVKNLKRFEYYEKLSLEDKNIVELSAYLHDVGKGPKTKWENGKQKPYPDHPADAIPMLERILTEDFEVLNENEIRKICLLVVYHDLIGDILERGRSKIELIDLCVSLKELKMLAAISLADVTAISPIWSFTIEAKMKTFIDEISLEIS